MPSVPTGFKLTVSHRLKVRRVVEADVVAEPLKRLLESVVFSSVDQC
jgi:hypothetical protein